MDTVINKEMSDNLIILANRYINNNYVFKFNRIVPENHSHEKHNKPHPAICLLRLEDYWNIGGCEEDLVGHYGHTDPSFWYRARGKVNVHIFNDIPLLRRELVSRKILSRKNDGSIYWKVK